MNSELHEMISKIGKIQSGMRATREQNRRDFPLTTAAMDSLRREFNDGEPPFEPRVIFAEESGKTIGRRE
jgi:hypothetical protein